MATYVLMTRLDRSLKADLAKRQEIGEKWKDTIAEKCPDVKWLAHYALLGSFDFMDIYEADNEITAAKVSLLSQSLGAVNAESWTAIPYKEYLDLIEDV